MGHAKGSKGGEDLPFSERSKPTQAAKDPYIQCSYCKHHQHVEANCWLKNWKDQSSEWQKINRSMIDHFIKKNNQSSAK
ncbi:hypothetical protein EMPG_13250 [Blastomyces silverae]|uniref:Uncharacterized protein n=1 Tax=Blastomyces silverae TaxID=2060906 RepID=A0A0H1BQW1_9EURO|nr:hypothetical protein EMPG_13250 [Blastomyces silverae]